MMESHCVWSQQKESDAASCLTVLPPCVVLQDSSGTDCAQQSKPHPSVHNIVSTSLVCGSPMPINLDLLKKLLPCTNYDRKRFAAITIRINRPKCTALLFTSGKLVITGVKSWHECLLASLSIARLINSRLVGSRYYITNCDIQNIVSHVEMRLPEGKQLNLQALYQDRSSECTYQRNMFPGLILRAKNCPVVLLCFYSGQIVLTGGKNINDIERGWEMLWRTIQSYIF